MFPSPFIPIGRTNAIAYSSEPKPRKRRRNAQVINPSNVLEVTRNIVRFASSLVIPYARINYKQEESPKADAKRSRLTTELVQEKSTIVANVIKNTAEDDEVAKISSAGDQPMLPPKPVRKDLQDLLYSSDDEEQQAEYNSPSLYKDIKAAAKTFKLEEAEYRATTAKSYASRFSISASAPVEAEAPTSGCKTPANTPVLPLTCCSIINSPQKAAPEGSQKNAPAEGKRSEVADDLSDIFLDSSKDAENATLMTAAQAPPSYPERASSIPVDQMRRINSDKAPSMKNTYSTAKTQGNIVAHNSRPRARFVAIDHPEFGCSSPTGIQTNFGPRS